MLLLYVMYRFFNRFRKMLFEAETIDSIFYVSHHYHIYIHICTGMYIIIYDICRYVEVHVEASVSVLIQTSRLQRNFFSGQVSRVQMATSWLCDLHQPNEQCESRAHSNPPIAWQKKGGADCPARCQGGMLEQSTHAWIFQMEKIRFPCARRTAM